MITLDKKSWQIELSEMITDPAVLWQRLELNIDDLNAAKLASKQFPLRVTESYLARIQKANLNDPLLKQILPVSDELEDVPGYMTDPLQEADVNPVTGMLHKYHGRVLITLTSSCAIHCRYCFRRHFPYAENNPGRAGWENIFNYIKNDSSINEVILSGGDPLSVSDHLLQEFISQLCLIPQIKTLRFHTRLPIVLPSRVTKELCDMLRALPLRVVIIVHCNHAQEISDDVVHALLMLRSANVHLLNQSVLLKDINDDADILIELSEKLFSAGVLPYYLHVLDKVKGAAHFDLAREKAIQIHAEITAKLPGYLVPKLTREDPGATSKTII